MDREFPFPVDSAPGDVTRREFLRLAAASAALAGIGGCMAPPPEPILPYVTQASGEPGTTRVYATAMAIDGDATGLLVESRDGRPVKVEGNPDHPSSLGAAGVFAQASLLQLYDPARAQGVRRGRVSSSWSAFRAAFAPEAVAALAGASGAGLRLLLEPTTSPLVARQLAAVRERFPEARVHFYSPVSRRASYDGTRLAFGRPLQTQLALDRADVIVSIDADILASGPCHLVHARQWADRRRVRAGSSSMNRLHAAETMLSPTGMSADARLAVRPTRFGRVMAALAGAIDGTAVPGDLAPLEREWTQAAARDLIAARGRGAVVVGDRLPPELHALGHALNARLGNLGGPVRLTEPTWIDAGEPSHALPPLVDEMGGGDVRVLLVLGGNPAYTAPGDLEIDAALGRVPLVAYLGTHDNETARRAGWRVAEAHYLESWGDARAYDGTVSIVQPLIAPLYAGRTTAEVLSALLGEPQASAYRLTRTFWESRLTESGAAWQDALRRGVIAGTALAPIDAVAAAAMVTLPPDVPGGAGDDLDLLCPAGSSVHDGRFAGNPWLQELPDPVSKLTWGNAAYLGPRTAARLGVQTEELLELRAGDRRVQVPALVVPGVAENAVVVPMGYGRLGEAAAEGVGANVMPLRSAAAEYAVPGVAVRRPMTIGQDGQTPIRQRLAVTQHHWDMEARPIALAATLEAFRRDPDVAHQRAQLPTLYAPVPQEGTQWAMAIDLTVCTGCSACVVACQAENNIPVVGQAGVLERREMHWLRIDRYVEGGDEAPRSVVQPMLCQHCENAPCEYVCPVNATVHSPDGLNEMVYNRCVGTRFCSNNCPYKVRRFNWFDYNAGVPEVRALAMNPEVTVRERGVMEKCTFCVQRIRTTELRARIDGRAPDPGEVTTACEQACPTRAIVFGSLNPADSDVAALHREPHAYGVLHDLGTRPRVRYLARVTNPAPPPGGTT